MSPPIERPTRESALLQPLGDQAEVRSTRSDDDAKGRQRPA